MKFFVFFVALFGAYWILPAGLLISSSYAAVESTPEGSEPQGDGATTPEGAEPHDGGATAPNRTTAEQPRLKDLNRTAPEQPRLKELNRTATERARLKDLNHTAAERARLKDLNHTAAERAHFIFWNNLKGRAGRTISAPIKFLKVNFLHFLKAGQVFQQNKKSGPLK